MHKEILPVGNHPPALEFSHFPTRYQALIWRNWEMVPPARLAGVLRTDEESVLTAAGAMGLTVPPQTNPDWMRRGYLTIIRNNWHLLDYEQLLELLGWQADQLAGTMKDEDFFWTKTGKLKPDCKPIFFRPLNEQEIRRTAEIKKIICRYFPTASARAYQTRVFEFEYAAGSGLVTDKSPFAFNFIHPFSVPSGDLFLHPEADPLPDAILANYASCGVRGIWLHAIMHQLYPIPGAEEFSAGAETRLHTIKKLAEKCAGHGLGLYLYLNEPRGMPEAFYRRLPEWRGAKVPGAIVSANCTSRTDQPLRWLEEACRRVFTLVPDLAGAFIISMSENATHCHSRWHGNGCPYCRARAIPEVIAEVIGAVERGIHAAAPEARVIVSDWAWSSSPAISDDRAFEFAVMERLPQNIFLMCVSEWGKLIDLAGITGSVTDYSISQVGPSERSAAIWHRARQLGLKTVAKVQLNNSWESAAVPYLPVPYLIREHLERLDAAKVDGLMLSWSLGGYPGGNLEFMTSSPEQVAEARFGAAAAGAICAAWKKFSEAFRYFPFHINVIYFAPMNFGPMNLLYTQPTGYEATMIGFPYDDLKKWRGIYPEDIFEERFRMLVAGWREGVKLLGVAGQKVDRENAEVFADLKNVAVTAECHFRSTWNQIRFIRRRDDVADRARLAAIVQDELEVTLKLHEIARRDPRIGYEPCNHYFYSLNDLREKIINCETILSSLTDAKR